MTHLPFQVSVAPTSCIPGKIYGKLVRFDLRIDLDAIDYITRSLTSTVFTFFLVTTAVQMIGVILFDNHDDLLYVFNDEEFRQRIKSVSDSLDISPPQYASFEGDEGDDEAAGHVEETLLREAESMILMQIFSPLLTSYRIMNQQFHNSYDCISCDDGSTVAFYENQGFLLIAVAKTTVNAVHLVRVCFDIMQHVCGPSLSM